MRARYCSRDCQVQDRVWHKQHCRPDVAGPRCMICMAGDPAPVRKGCQCEGPLLLAHPRCVAERAAAEVSTRGEAAWLVCDRCHAPMTGRMDTDLAGLWVELTAGMSPLSIERIAADTNHARELSRRMCFVEAESALRSVHARIAEVYGHEDRRALMLAVDISDARTGQGAFDDAHIVLRHVSEAHARLLSRCLQDWLDTSDVLGSVLMKLEVNEEAEVIRSKLRAAADRVPGVQHRAKQTGTRIRADECALRSLLATLVKSRGADDAEALSVTARLCDMLAQREEYDDAALVLEDACPVMATVLGASNDTSRLAHELLDHCRAMIGTSAAVRRACWYGLCTSSIDAASACSKCARAIYCSRQCQASDWARHKPHCRRVPKVR